MLIVDMIYIYMCVIDSLDQVERREILNTVERCFHCRQILKTMKGCDLNTKMSEESSIPEEFLDTLVNEFAYDPVRLSFSEDPAQVLYNCRTLEKICYTKHSAVNPYSRQPFDIKNSIPQIELSQQMRQYIENNRKSMSTPRIYCDS